MINPQHFYITFILMCFSYVMSAQCPGPPLSVTGTGSVSTCEANGSITITPVGGVPFTGPGGTQFYYNSIVGPITVPGQQSTTFNSLGANTYTIEVADACGTIATTTVAVPGTHQQLELGIYFEDAICDGSGGGVICGIPDKGLPPYQYRLYDASTTPPTLLSIGPDSCLTNLAAGTYQIQVWDQCNNFQTRDVIIATKQYPTDFTQYHYRWYPDCNTMCSRFYARENTNDFDPEYPVQWEVTSSTVPILVGQSGQLDFKYDYDTICWSPPFQTGQYVMTMTDACGLVDTYRLYFSEFFVSGNDRYDCNLGNWFYFYNSTYYIPGTCTEGTVTFETYQVPVGAPQIPPTTQDTFYNLQDGTYCWRVTDCCGNVDSYCRNFTSPRWVWRANITREFGCTPGLISFKCGYSSLGGPDPAGNEEYLLTSAPPGYPNTLPEAFSYYGTVNGPPGQYCFTITDTCNRSIDTCFVMNNPLDFTYTPTVVAGCVTANSISVDFNQTSGNLASAKYYFYQIAPVSQTIQSNGINTAWYNLSPGTYRVRIYNNYQGCDYVNDTIVIPEYIAPGLEAAWGIECDNGVGLITVVGEDGQQPYTYELFQGPVTRPLQSSPTFPGLPLGTYSIRIYDDCLNSAVTTVSIEPFAPLIKGDIDPICEGDDAYFYVDSLAIATYTWSGPNGFTSNNANIFIPGATIADAGSYTVDIQVFNPDATACVDQQVTLDLVVLDCSCEMDTIVVTPMTCRNDNDAMATAYLNGTAPYTYLWSSGGNTQTISNLSAGTYSVTVTDAKGCSDTGVVTVKNPVNLTVNIANVTDAGCHGGADGSITALAAGGVQPYTWNWDKDGVPYATANSGTIGNLGAGVYTVTVIDANGCERTDQATVGQAPKLALKVDVNDVSCGGNNDGTATAGGAGGTVPYDYLWSDGQTGETATGLAPGTYTVSVTDANRCCAIAYITVDAVNCDLCAAGMAGTIDICTVIANDPNSPLASLDCDNGGIDNQTECDNGGDPADPADDCDMVDQAGLSLCVIILNNPNNPLALADCDNGGVPNGVECSTLEDPDNPADDCRAAIDANLDICVLINLDPTHPLANQDCDQGGVSNIVECQNGQDPSDPADDCTAASEAGMDICTIIAGGHPWSTLDCDNGGVDNETECANGTDPNDPSDDLDCPLDPCVEAANENVDICVLLSGNPLSPLATLDCDNGGIDNQTECANGEDPSDPDDDCQAAIDGNVNICALIANNPDHVLANADCDNGGVPNIVECQSGENPADPADDCMAAIDSGTNICALINYDPASPLATLDCDNGGVDNYTECVNGEDPSDPADDCIAASEAGMDICTIIAGGHPWGSLDCDNGGVDNETECASGTDPNDPSDDLDCPLDPCVEAANDPTDMCSLIDGDPTGPLATLDCDGGGVDNGTECMEGTDPTDPADDCDAAISAGTDICAVLTADPNNPLATADCDDGGVDNQTECAEGTNPNSPTDDCDAANSAGTDICALINYDPNHPLANADCDDGGVDNYTECVTGNDPSDPADDCHAAAQTGMDICTIIAGGHPWATLDCDDGGIDNQTECAEGTDPTMPSDDIDCPVDFCEEAATDGTDICVVLTADPNHPLATLDCDNGGIDNATECANGTDPDEASDDCQAAAAGNVDICALINNDPDHPLANQDCDNGGVSNIDECNSSEEPFDPADDCQTALDEGLNICQLINYDPNHPLADLDCDDGGIDNYTECQNGGDPSEPSDDCQVVIDAELDICAILVNDPNNPLGSSDCDGDGVTNGMECTDSTDPLDPCDFEDTSITMPVTADQSDCEGLCPDLTPIMTILPGNIAGLSNVGVAVEVTELNVRDTDGSLIRVRIPNDPRFVFVWNPGLTNAALVPINNANWNYQGIILGLYHEWHYSGPSNTIFGGTTQAFGFEGTYDPQNTDGQTTITATVFPFSGGECLITNNTDSERLVYFE